MAEIGYARVSSLDQSPALQIDALKAAGCLRIFTEKASGTRASRPQLDKMLDHLRPGDVVVVWKLDRLGRSLRHLVSLVEYFDTNEIGFRSLTESMDTTTPGGRLIFHIFSALSEFEASLIRERTRAGLAAARARGRVGGRPTVMTPAKLSAARKLLRDGEQTVSEVARAVGVSRPTLYRALAGAST